MIDNVIYNFRNDNDWELNQTRTLDPFSLLQSNTLNQINTIYGDNIILTGMELFTVKDEVLKLTVKSGQVIKDKVLIQFKEDTIIFIPDYRTEEFKNRVKDSSLMLVVEYRFEKVIPAPIAKIRLIEESEYDPEIHLGLHRIFFDSNGDISEIVRLLTPKDNIVYEQILQEVSSVTASAVYNYFNDLRTEEIADLIGTYIRVKGTSISGYYTEDKYYLCRALPKDNYNLINGQNEIFKGILRVIATYNVDSKFYQNEYVLQLDPNTLVWKLNSQSITSDSTMTGYKIYHDLYLYEDQHYWYIYAKFRGNIVGGLEVYEVVFDSDQIIPCNIEEKAPDLLTQGLVLTASDKTARIPTRTYVNNCIIWNETNDGHFEDGTGPDKEGHGLDADLLDGKHRTYFEDLIQDLREYVDQEVARLDTKINELRDDMEKYFIRKEQKHSPNGVAILTNSDRTYTSTYDPDAEAFEVIEDTSPIGNVVPQSELYIDRMFGQDGIVFTDTNENPTGTRRINCEGLFYATKVYNPAFKDIAEVFEADSGYNMTNCVHKIMALDCSSGVIRPCKTTDYAIIGVCSDTYGTLLGASEEEMVETPNLLPIALCGTVWVELENALEPDYPNNYLGCLVGPGTNGKGRIISRMDDRVCVGMIVQYNPDTSKGNLVKILVGSYFK